MVLSLLVSNLGPPVALKTISDVWKQWGWPGPTYEPNVYVESKYLCKWSVFFFYLWKSFFEAICWANFFLNLILSRQFFFIYSGAVKGEVKSGKRDFQDGATGRNKIIFRNIFWSWRQRNQKEKWNQRSFHYSSPIPPYPRPVLG